jgi:hypothetical protein
LDEEGRRVLGVVGVWEEGALEGVVECGVVFGDEMEVVVVVEVEVEAEADLNSTLVFLCGGFVGDTGRA